MVLVLNSFESSLSLIMYWLSLLIEFVVVWVDLIVLLTCCLTLNMSLYGL